MSTFEKLQGFVSNVWVQLALGLILLVVGWKMNANSANSVLFIAWAILVSCVFRSPWLADSSLLPRVLITMSCAGVFGLGIYFTLWTTPEPPVHPPAPAEAKEVPAAPLRLAVISIGEEGKMKSNVVSLLGTSPSAEEPPIAPGAAFTVRVEKVANCSNDFPTGWFATESHRAPIYGWIMVQFTNRLPKPMMVDSYIVERQTDDKAPWERVSLRFGLMKGTSFNGSNPGEVRTIKCTSFDEAITNKTLAAGESIRGWIALRQPHKFGRLRLTIDTGDGWYTENVRNRVGKGIAMQPDMFELIPYEKPIDISLREVMSDDL
jgi:hypothetical protein